MAGFSQLNSLIPRMLPSFMIILTFTRFRFYPSHHQTRQTEKITLQGPSLGTNFTLCCPYTILAHYQELEFAEQYGVSRHLVRVSIGLEKYEFIQETFENALNAIDFS